VFAHHDNNSLLCFLLRESISLLLSTIKGFGQQPVEMKQIGVSPDPITPKGGKILSDVRA
jgi:hypothetical protein